jgi:hypothetical protein
LRHENQRANKLAQQASGYDVNGRNFHIQEKPMHEDLEFSHAGTDESAKSTALVGLADPLTDASQPAKPTRQVSLADFPRLTCDQPGQFAREVFKSAQ